MESVDNLTSDANQLTKFVLGDGSTVIINLVYAAANQRWNISVSRDTFIVTNIGVCIHPNFMREWRNILPFGIGCTTIDGGDPVFVDDFSTGRATLHVLDAADVALVERTLFGAGVPA